MIILRAALVLLAVVCLNGVTPAAADNATPSWSQNYGAPSGGARAQKIARDAAGNVYVVGEHGGGTMMLGPHAVTPSTYANAFVAKFGPDGTVPWANNIGGGNSYISPKDIAVDSAGNVVVAGYFGGDLTDGQATQTPGSVQDAVVIKYDGNGNLIWSRTLGASGIAASFTAVAVDSADNVIVAGDFVNGPLGSLPQLGQSDSFVRRYDASGTYLNQVPLGGANAVTNTAAIATRGTDIYVVGMSSASMTSPTLPIATGTLNGFLLRYDADLNNTWRQAIIGGQVTTTCVAVDSAGKVIVSGHYHSGPLTTPALDPDFGSFVIKATPVDATTSTFDWATTIDSKPNATTIDAGGNAYVTGWFFSRSDGPMMIPGLRATKLAAADGAVSWSATIDGPETSVTGMGIAVDAAGSIVLAATMVGDLPELQRTAIGSSDLLMVGYDQQYLLTAGKIGTGDGTVTADSGSLACGISCSVRYASGLAVVLTAQPASGSVFAGWSGNCMGAATTATVTMSGPRSCTATFNLNQTPAPPTPTPPAPVPPAPTPAPTIVELPIVPGQGAITLGQTLGNPGPGATITVTLASGAALPPWLTFDRATLSFTFEVPVPADLPIQPAAADTRAAGPEPLNPVYPLTVLAQTMPITLTVDGAPYLFNLDFYAPRRPTALTALSYSRTGRSGDGASGRPALSWDGGQILFETSARNLSSTAGTDTRIARYHGLSGNRDLVSQAAAGGGGIADALGGPATAPAVSANGAYGVFAATSGLALTPSTTLKQIYRTGLAYPRVVQNPATTPAAQMVSTTPGGIPANAPADKPAISQDGNFIAFESAATNLGWNDGGTQIWRKDTAGGAVTLVSSSAQGAAGNGHSRNASLSWDGRFAAFDSTATNLVPGAAGRQVYLKDIASGAITALGIGAAPRIDARATSVVFATQTGGIWQIQRFDAATGRVSPLTTVSSDADQPTVSADGRFVAWRAAADDGNNITQIWVRDVFRGITALVSQTAGGTPGSGNSYDPALSGDGAAIAFGSQARDLVNGNPNPGQIHLAGNPLALPARTAHWYVPAGTNQAWAIERWGDQAYVARLAYQPDGAAGWVAGRCIVADLGCTGMLNPGAASLGLWFPERGHAVASVNGGPNLPLQPYPVLGPSTRAMPGLPQGGWWYEPANAAAANGIFLQFATQNGANGAIGHTAHLSLLGYDAQGAPVWYAAEGTLGADLSLEGTLYRHTGGAAPTATTIGTFRLSFAAGDKATLHLPDGSTRSLSRFRF